jgi:xanthine phosphoribosyltransferase
MEMGKEIARLFKDDGVTKIITVEASGIAIAVAAGAAMGVPAVFAKKNKSANVGSNVYSAVVHSYTHGTDYNIVVDKEYLSKGDRLLIVDDFLAAGNAIAGLLSLADQAGASVAGAAIAVEKAFQHGGDKYRESGLRIESLAKIAEMSEDSLTFVE